MLCWVADAPALERLGASGVSAVLGAGVDCVQVRDRSCEAAELLTRVDAVCRAAQETPRPVRVLVNRRVDVARCAGADGVHLGFDALPPERARALLPEGAWIGLSAHSAEEVARAQGVDYAHLAPIFTPLSKPPERPALGLRALAEACRQGPPVWAQGGLDASRAAEAVAAGAAGIAVSGAISLAADPPRATRSLRAALDGAPDA